MKLAIVIFFILVAFSAVPAVQSARLPLLRVKEPPSEGNPKLERREFGQTYTVEEEDPIRLIRELSKFYATGMSFSLSMSMGTFPPAAIPSTAPSTSHSFLPAEDAPSTSPTTASWDAIEGLDGNVGGVKESKMSLNGGHLAAVIVFIVGTAFTGTILFLVRRKMVMQSSTSVSFVSSSDDESGIVV